jgi:hypothetical protein
MATITPTTTTTTTTTPPTTAAASQAATTTATVDEAGASSLRGLTVRVGLAAAAATTALAAALHAAGVSFEIDGETIPMLGFAQMVLIGALIGGVLAGSLRKRSAAARTRFLQSTAVLTVLSCVPSVAMPQDAATKVALVATHLVAAAIVVPVLARRLAD